MPEEQISPSRKLYSEGRDLMERGALDEAVAKFHQSIQYQPHFKTLELLGECLIRLHRYKDAIVPLAAATTLNTGGRAPTLLAEALLSMEDYFRARQVAEVALGREPQNKRALVVLQKVKAVPLS